MSYIKTTCEIGFPVMFLSKLFIKLGLVVKCLRVMLTRVRLDYKQEMVLQLSHKKEMVVPLRKKEMVTHPLRVQLTRGKLMKKYLGSTKWRLMRMNVGWKRTHQMMRMTC
jgi:hypothetical protein